MRDDLNNVWVCTNCKASFMFSSDVDDHKEQTGHTEITQINLENGQVTGSHNSDRWQNENR
jgi:hypothetical protein